jgi:hypothetical protein
MACPNLAMQRLVSWNASLFVCYMIYKQHLWCSLTLCVLHLLPAAGYGAVSYCCAFHCTRTAGYGAIVVLGGWQGHQCMWLLAVSDPSGV